MTRWDDLWATPGAVVTTDDGTHTQGVVDATDAARVPFDAPTLHVPDLPEDTDVLGASLLYVRAGWYVGPVKAGAAKNPGSALGKGWPSLTSRDPHQVTAWFAGCSEGTGLFLHCGRSGALVLDADNYDRLPDNIRAEIDRLSPPFQSTRHDDPHRGHYVFAMPTDRLLGNSVGALGKAFGEVRGANGVIVVAPSQHAKTTGRYQWITTGAAPYSKIIADALPTATDAADSATDAAVAAFMAAHTDAAKPSALVAVTNRFMADVAAGGSRHGALVECAAWAMREARAGLYPATSAHDQLRELFYAAMKAKPTPGRFPRTEFGNVLAWAVGQALQINPAERRAQVEQRLPERTSFMSGAYAAPVIDNPETVTTTEEPETARPSWTPEDLTAVLDGSSEPLEPTLLPRTDGHCLLYAGKVHSIHGETESGKSLVLQAEVARLLMLGERVVIIDYESTAATVVGRLLQMGVPPGMIRSGLAYIRPERSPLDPAEAESWHALLDQPTALVILDGVTEALSTMGRSTNDNDEVTDWVRRVPRQMAQRTGAAVVLVDHVTKSTEGRGRFAIGAQAKLATLDGASYSLEVVEPLGRGMRGTLRLWVGKDREGAVRPHCGRFKPGDRTQLAATIVVDSTAGPITMEVQPPEDLVGDDRKPFRPTHLMEQLSRALEGSAEALSTNALVKGSDYVEGKGQWKRAALDLLVAEGYVNRTPGSNNSALHTSAKAYREADETTGTHSATFLSAGPSGTRVPYREGDPGPTQNGHPTGSGTHSGPTGTHWTHSPSNGDEPASSTPAVAGEPGPLTLPYPAIGGDPDRDAALRLVRAVLGAEPIPDGAP